MLLRAELGQARQVQQRVVPHAPAERAAVEHAALGGEVALAFPAELEVRHRVAEFHGASPQFIACSATIVNAKEFAERLCGGAFTLVDQDGSPQGPRTVLFWNPPLKAGPQGMTRDKSFVHSARLFACRASPPWAWAPCCATCTSSDASTESSWRGARTGRWRTGGGLGVNGEHEVRLDRIEESLRGLHAKVDSLIEEGAVARTEVAWLKWGMRLLVAGVVGLGGVTAGRLV